MSTSLYYDTWLVLGVVFEQGFEISAVNGCGAEMSVAVRSAYWSLARTLINLLGEPFVFLPDLEAHFRKTQKRRKHVLALWVAALCTLFLLMWLTGPSTGHPPKTAGKLSVSYPDAWPDRV